MRAVRFIDALIEVLHLEHRQKRTKGFFGYDPRIMRRVGKYRRQIEESLLELGTFRTLAPSHDLRSPFHRVRYLRLDLIALHFRMHWPESRILVHSVPDFQALHLSDQLLHELAVKALDYIQPLHGETCLAAVVEAADRCAGQGLVDIRVLTHDHRIAAPKLQRNALHKAAGHFHDVFAGLAFAREGNPAHFWVLQKLFAHNAARSGHDVQYALRQAGLIQDFNNAQGRERSCRSRLHDNGAACCECGSDFRAHERNRKIPWHNGAGHSDRLLQHHAVHLVVRKRHVGAANLGSKTGVKVHAVQEVLDLSLRVADRFSLLLCKQDGEILKLFLHQFNALQNELRAGLGRGFGPGLKRGVRGIDRGARVALVTFRCGVHHFTCGGINHIVSLPGA